MYEGIKALNRAFIVSCQAYEGEPLYGPDHMAAMAASVIKGGAQGIRTNGPADVAAIRSITSLPIIGIQKMFIDGRMTITPDFAMAQALVAAGADIVALDATAYREEVGGGQLPPLSELIARIHHELARPVMADISNVAEGIAAEQAGADLVATTLAGYTPYTTISSQHGPDIELVRKLTHELHVPVVAEGRIETPESACLALEAGAYAVVVGSAITRPELITRKFVTAIEQQRSRGSSK